MSLKVKLSAHFQVTVSSSYNNWSSVASVLRMLQLYGQAGQGSLVRRTTVCGNQGRLETAAAGGAGRRPAKGVAAPLNQSREAHRSARPHQFPEGGSGLDEQPRPSKAGVRGWRA